MKVIPDIICSIIIQLRYFHEAKNSFDKQENARKDFEGTSESLEKVVKGNATPCFSTYRMVDQLIRFRTESTKVLRIVHSISVKDVDFPEEIQVTDTDRKYLERFCEILKVFKTPTIKPQESLNPDIHQTIAMADELLTTKNDNSNSKIQGLIQDDETPEEYMKIEDNGKSPDDLSEEKKSAETEVWLTIDDIEDHDEDIYILTATEVFGECVYVASCFSSFVKRVH